MGSRGSHYYYYYNGIYGTHQCPLKSVASYLRYGMYMLTCAHSDDSS